MLYYCIVKKTKILTKLFILIDMSKTSFEIEKKLQTQTSNDWIILVVFGIIVLSALIVGSFYDFNISEFVYKSGKIDWKIGETFSSCFYIPTEIFLITFSLSFARSGFVFITKKNKFVITWRLLITIVSLIVSLGIVGFASWHIFKVFKKFLENGAIGIFGFVLVILVILASSFCLWFFVINKMDQINIWKVCLVFFIGFAVIELWQGFWKAAMSRPRPRYVFDGHEDEFRSWYDADWFRVWKEKISNHTSFPSGHTAFATVAILGCGALCEMNMFNKTWKKYLVILSSIVLCLAMCMARIFACAHFLTDTAWSLLFGLIFSYFAWLICSKTKPLKINI